MRNSVCQSTTPPVTRFPPVTYKTLAPNTYPQGLNVLTLHKLKKLTPLSIISTYSVRNNNVLKFSLSVLLLL